MSVVSRKRARRVCVLDDAACGAHRAAVVRALSDGPRAWEELEALCAACAAGAASAAGRMADARVPEFTVMRAHFDERADLAERASSVLHRLSLWVLLSEPRVSDGNNIAGAVREAVSAAVNSAGAGLADPVEDATEHYAACGKLLSKALKYARLDAEAAPSRTTQYYEFALAAHHRAAATVARHWYMNLDLSLRRVQAAVYLHIDCFTSPEAAAAETAAAVSAMTC